jgi:thiosulfate dehydrogenase
MDQQEEKINELLKAVRMLTSLVIFLLLAMLFILVVWLYGDPFKNEMSAQQIHKELSDAAATKVPEEIFWSSPDLNLIQDVALRSQIEYGKELIAHTSRYLGPKGLVTRTTNGMNCQNCHLEAGTKIFGNNYSAVASTYPKFRPRSGAIEDIHKRVNDCLERSLNGKPLDTLSTEMKAIRAYITFLGTNVKKGVKPNGAGLKDVTFLNRAADPVKGKLVYAAKCVSCHMVNGQGQLAAGGIEYTYPPLWGIHSYNDGAGLFRISNFAKYIKYNMPMGTVHSNPVLSDEEAWDVAAFINSKDRPHLKTPKDWPDISKKPIDHPFGPYVDSFDENQHKYGPYQPIIEAQKKSSQALPK